MNFNKNTDFRVLYVCYVCLVTFAADILRSSEFELCKRNFFSFVIQVQKIMGIHPVDENSTAQHKHIYTVLKNVIRAIKKKDIVNCCKYLGNRGSTEEDVGVVFPSGFNDIRSKGLIKYAKEHNSLTVEGIKGVV